MPRLFDDAPADNAEKHALGGHRPRVLLDEPAEELRFPREVLKQRHDHKYQPRRKIRGTHSRAIDRGGLSWAISACSREGRFLISFEDMLNEHLGRQPSIVEKLLIQRASRVALHLELMDHKAIAEGVVFSTSDNARYCAWSNGLARMLCKLGLQPTQVPEPKLELSDWVQKNQRSKTRAA
jgi:hypothetical protein